MNAFASAMVFASTTAFCIIGTSCCTGVAAPCSAVGAAFSR
jgi:hypothetical protein